jgi:DNA-binding NtrC family response regulator
MNGFRETILVVEDDAGNQHLLTALLESEGYNVLTATSLATALQILGNRTVDLVLTDSMSREPDGAIASLEQLQLVAGDTPIALVTGHRISHLRGTCAIVAKPFDLETLYRDIRKCLDEAAEARSTLVKG